MPCPVYPGPASQRPDGNRDISPGKGNLRIPSRSSVSQPDPCRRDQPRTRQGAVGTPGSQAERQVTVAGKTYRLPQLFMVMATQNPIEQEGTYPLPEAQLDRFMLHVKIELSLSGSRARGPADRTRRGQAENCEVYLPGVSTGNLRGPAGGSENPCLGCADRLHHSADPGDPSSQMYGADLAHQISYGASPRSTIALDRCARVHAWMNGQDFATPSDVAGRPA